jgi:hypothetical protein
VDRAVDRHAGKPQCCVCSRGSRRTASVQVKHLVRTSVLLISCSSTQPSSRRSVDHPRFVPSEYLIRLIRRPPNPDATVRLYVCQCRSSIRRGADDAAEVIIESLACRYWSALPWVHTARRRV